MLPNRNDARSIDRRNFVKASLIPAVFPLVTSLDSRFAKGAEPAPAAPDIIDSNVHLFEWPFRKLKYDRTEALIATARDLPPRVRARGLRWESAVIVALAGRLALRLRRGDPLATRVKLSKNDFAAAFLTGILARRG